MNNDESVVLESYHVANGYIISACGARIDDSIWYAITLFRKDMELPYLIKNTQSIIEAMDNFNVCIKTLGFFFDGENKKDQDPSLN